jgi:hypothetical protein
MYPGGERGFTECYIGLYLTLCSSNSIEMSNSLSIINCEGMCVEEREEMHDIPTISQALLAMLFTNNILKNEYIPVFMHHSTRNSL